MTAGLACGSVFGVPLGLLVAELTSWRWTFGLIALTGAIAATAIRLRGRVANVAAPSFMARLRTLSHPLNVVTILVSLFLGVSSLGLYTYLVPVLDALGYGAEQGWLIWAWGWAVRPAHC